MAQKILRSLECCSECCEASVQAVLSASCVLRLVILQRLAKGQQGVSRHIPMYLPAEKALIEAKLMKEIHKLLCHCLTNIT